MILVAKQGKARRGGAWLGTARHGWAMRGKAWHGKAGLNDF